MRRLSFKPRSNFVTELKELSRIDKQIVAELKSAVDILCSGLKLPREYKDHPLTGSYEGYQEFHLRDTPKGEKASLQNDVLVIYKIREQEMVLVGVHIGSHPKLFKGKFKKNR